MKFETNTYEFAVYNQEVRDIVNTGESHRQLDDGWAENRYIQVRAKTEERATTELRRRYPEAKGYVFSNVVKFMD